jgi:hypothetical protein
MNEEISASHRVTVPADADTVWQAMRNFADLSWAAGVAEVRVEGEGTGMLRKVRLDGGTDWILERLTALDDAGRELQYALEGDGLPGLEDYRATAGIDPLETGCAIRWQCSAGVRPEDLEEMQALIEGMAEGMASLFAARFQQEPT